MKKISTVVIPVAGFGSRMFPVTVGITKAMLPLINKPVIQYLIEECVEAEIENVVIVMNERQECIKDYFSLAYCDDRFSNNEEIINLRELVSKINITYVIQDAPLGLGHAIYCAKPYIKEDYFGVILGDNPILYDNSEYGIVQLNNAFVKNKGYYVGVKEVLPEQTHSYGIVEATDYTNEYFLLTSIEEKPNIPKSNFAVLGRYILGSNIFNYIENITSSGEIQLTEAIKTAISEEIVYGIKLNGTCHDTGNKEGFVKAYIDYAFKKGEKND